MASRPCTNSIFGFGSYLATLFLGALNDNISKLLAICFASAVFGSSSPRAARYLSLASACFILPYLLFSSIAGYLADRYLKKSVMVWTKVAEILIMATGCLMAAQRSLYGLLIVLFFMGTQSAFFSPAKYGFLPETHSVEHLSRANGLTQLFTFTAIIFGGMFGGFLSASCAGKPAWGFAVCIALAILGTGTSLFITPTTQHQPELKFRLQDPITPNLCLLRTVCSSQPTLKYTVFGSAFFWFMGTVVQLLLMLYAKNELHGSDNLVGILQAAIALGIALGCTAAGLFSKKRIAFHFIYPAGICLSILLLSLGILPPHRVLSGIIAFLCGFSGGFFILPLTTGLQELPEEKIRGRFLAAANVTDCLAMLLGSLYLLLVPPLFHGKATGGFLLLALITLAATLLCRHGFRKYPIH